MTLTASNVPKYKVLIVDDEKPIRDIIGRYLANKGFEVLEAGSGEEALKYFQIEKPHIVLLDINMPGLSGLETLSRLKKISPECKIIMITALWDEEMFKKCSDLGAIYYIVKPIELQYLDALIFGKLL